MSVRRTRGSQLMVGTGKFSDCTGATTKFKSFTSGALQKGFWKSNIVKSDFVRPTPYSMYFINTSMPGYYEYESVHAVCQASTPQAYTVYNEYNIPFGANLYHFACAGPACLNFVISDNTIGPNAECTRIQQQCENGALKKLKDQKVNALVTLGESKESLKTAAQLTKIISATLLGAIRGIRNPLSLVEQAKALHERWWKTKDIRVPKKNKVLKRFHNAMYDAHRRGLYRQEDLLDRSANSWLALRYGLLPLMGDVQNYHDLIYLKQLEFFNTGLSSVRHLYRNEYKISGRGDNLGEIILMEGVSKTVAQVKLHFKMKCHKALQMKKLGMSLRDVPSAIYELIPFSFVSDWFKDVGSYLDLLGASYGLEFVSGFFSIKEDVHDKGEFRGTINGASKQPIPKERSEREYGYFRRTLYASFPMPSIPPFKSPFSSLLDPRVLDSITLTTQLLRDKKMKVPRQSPIWH